MKAIRLNFKILLALTLLLGQFVQAQDVSQYGTPFTGVPDPGDAVIYQVNMRSFSPTRDFHGVISRLDYIRDLGVNVIYLLPIHPVGTVNAFNSPYCVKDYMAVNPEFGSLADLQTLIEEAHNRGMAVMLDWVANHTSWDNAWISSHKDWYKQDASGNIVSPSLGWTDVAQLNFANDDMRDAMISAMKYWVYTSNCDGFRCDYSDGPPADFWKQAIDSLRNIKTHKLLLLAEGARSDHFASGFNYTFGFRFYEQLKAIYSNNETVEGIDNIITSEYNDASESNRVVHYTTNHDVNSNGTPLDWFGEKSGSMAAFLVAAYMKGVPFIYNGQEVGYPDPLYFLTTNSLIDWNLNPAMVAEYSRIIEFYNSSNALRKGVLTSYNTADVCAFKRVYENDTVFVVANLRNVNKSYTFPTGIAYQKKYDAFSNEAIDLGSGISLSAYEYRVFADSGAVIPVTGLTVSSENETVDPEGTIQLYAIPAPVNATYKSILWSSTDTTVASVSSTGLVTGISPGTTLIIGKNANQSFADTCMVTVTGIAVTGVTISKIAESIPANSTSQLSADVIPDDASYKIVTWESSNPDIATVSSTGLVRGISPGDALIIVKTVNNSKKDTCELTVTGTAVSGIVFNQEQDTVTGGYTLQLGYTIMPDEATNKTVFWSSSNTAIATVDESGIVKGIAKGSAFIYAETEDGNKKDTCEIFVKPGNEFTVYFSKPATWASTIKIYYWDPLPAGILPAVNWPGVDMTPSNGWYKYTFTNISFTNLIFNDQTKQTGNLSRDKNGWYKNDIWYDSNPDLVEINEERDNNFRIYPNPLDGNFTILLKSGEHIASMKIVDLQGRIVFETNLTAMQTNLNVSLLRNCIYIVCVKSNSYTHFQKIFVK
ncbi:MAG: Ig-like domain-containing protein [Bacteroidales bacterium]|nr:Ig-like domain-containing protein [Bacteroidales bacterium]